MVNKILFLLLLAMPTCIIAQNQIDSVRYAISLLNGCEGRIDYSEGIKMLKKYATQGDPDALNGLGICYLKGIGVIKNEELSHSCFVEATQQNSGKSWLNLGYLYSDEHSRFYNTAEAQTCYLKAIECGCLSAIYPAACSFYYGQPVDYYEAYRLFYKGAQMSQPECMYMVGLCNMYGQGTVVDFNLAEELLQNARLYGIKDAQEKLLELDSLLIKTQEDILNLQIHSAASNGEITYSFEAPKDSQFSLIITSSLHSDRYYDRSLKCCEGTNRGTVFTGFSSGVYTFSIIMDNNISSKTFLIK